MCKIKTIFQNKLDILIEKVIQTYDKNLNIAKYCSPKSKFFSIPWSLGQFPESNSHYYLFFQK